MESYNDLPLVPPGYRLGKKILEGRFTRIYRAHYGDSGLPRVLKVLKRQSLATLGSAATAALRREFDLLSRLDVPGVIKTYGLETVGGDLMMVLEDIGGASLDRHLERAPLPFASSLQIGLWLARTLGELHRRSLVHKDINPSHILWNSTSSQLRLIDFGIADVLPERTVGRRHPAALEGTLPYISPEQTGRMNRPVDYRTDFYSFGVTLYELLTGRRPFEVDDPLQLVHCHIAKKPEPVCTLRPDVPEVFSELVMKLLAKAPEDRYQSAEGLRVDLLKCLDLLSAGGGRFDLGLEDRPDRLLLTRRIYGREQEVARLVSAMDRAATGSRELVLVDGHPGVGKTALVHEAQKLASEKRGHFIEGKFDQVQGSLPYAGWSHAFTGFVHDILMESEDQLAAWRRTILDAVAGNGRVLTDVIPDLELVIGPQSPVPDLPPQEAQNRFRHVFEDFVKSIATPEHPLTVFLDDLQWASPASAHLAEGLLDYADLRYFLFIGALRDTEVEPTHVLARLIETWEQKGPKPTRLTLGALDADAVQQLVGDLLHLPPERARELASVVAAKTACNPFFIGQFLASLHETGVLTYQRGWRWQAKRLARASIAETVAELIARRIGRLPPASRDLLKLGACVGVEFDLELLARVGGMTLTEAMEALRDAAQEGLILVEAETMGVFVHDKIQEAAYGLTSAEDKRALHHRIARSLVATRTYERSDESLFATVEQLNRADAHLDADERRLSCALNALAGRRAKSSAAFGAAARFFGRAAELLCPDAWQVDYRSTLELYTDWAETEYMATHYETALKLFDLVLGNSRSDRDQIRVYRNLLLHDELSMRFADGARLVTRVLNELGVSFPPVEQIDAKATQAQRERLARNLRSRPIAEVLDLKEAEPPVREALELLAASHELFWMAYPDAFLFVVLEGTNLSLEHGLCGASAASMVFTASICGSLGILELAYQMGELAMRVVDRFDDAFTRASVTFGFYAMVSHWRQPLRSGREGLLRAYDDAVAVGNNQYACYSVNHICMRGLLEGDDLRALQKSMAFYAGALHRLKQEDAYIFFRPCQQLVENLLGKSSNPFALEGEFFSESSTMPELLRLRVYAGLSIASSAKLFLLCFLGDFREALRFVETAGVERWLQANLGQYQTCMASFFVALVCLQGADSASKQDRERLIGKAREIHAQLAKWSVAGAPSFAHLERLVAAELERVQGEPWLAVTAYRQAIAAAREHQITHVEALANELAGKFWLAQGHEEYARDHLDQALAGYRLWGADAKVALLLQQYSQWLRHEGTQAPAQDPPAFDVSTAVKASQTISREIEVARLGETMMRVVMENAGATRGLLLLERDGAWAVETDQHAEAKGEVDRAAQGSAMAVAEDWPTGVVLYVARTNESVVLDDAAAVGPFVREPYVARRRMRSLLCAPLLVGRRLVGIMVLENDLAPHAFAKDRVRLLEVLLSQAATSLENARVYETLRALLASERSARAEAERTGRMKDEFLATMSHELRTPLNAVLGWSQALRTKEMSTEVRLGLERVERNARAQAKLIDDLLDTSRIISGKVRLDMQPVELVSVIDAALESVRPAADAKTIEIESRLDPEAGAVVGDPGRLQQIFWNVLSNAIKFTPEKGRVRLELKQAGGRVTVVVSDTGIGIEPEFLPHVFERFRQADGSTTRRYGGLGLGLALTRHLVELHGGTIRATSPGESQGATFTIALPQPQRGADRALLLAPESAPSSTGRLDVDLCGLRVLVVDDDLDARDLVARALTERRAEVQAAASAAEGFVCLQSRLPNVLVSDIAMPGEDGYSFIRKVRNLPSELGGRIPAVALSAFARPEDRAKARQAGYDVHLAKPIDADELARQVASLALRLAP